MIRLSLLLAMTSQKINNTVPEQKPAISPLIVQLREKTPGTYKHSVRVANLARVAAMRLGLDSGIVYLAGLFHDIAKIENGDSFVEAIDGIRLNGDPVATEEHLRKILEHPHRGAKILETWGFPTEIIELVDTHHGTSSCKAQLSPELAAKMIDVRYQGTPPQSKPAALLMIADQFEAILNGELDEKNHLTRQEVQEITHRILVRVWNRLTEEKQLDLSGFNLSHFLLIEEAFTEALCNMHSVPSQKVNPQQSSAPVL